MKIRTIAFVILALFLFPAIGLAQDVTVYTVDMTEAHTQLVSSSPYVTKTPSGNSSLALGGTPAEIEDFVVGVSAGNVGGDPDVPQHNLYAYKITDPAAPGPKTKVIIATGNHNTETSGNWTFQGYVDFLLSSDPNAQWLRQLAEFYIYPLVNPDGRYTADGRGNPEMTAEGFGTDHNRVWNRQGEGLSTIDALTTAMQNDTGGDADYLFDFHSASSNFFYIISDLMDCPFVLAFLALDIGVGPSVSSGQPGMLRIWSMTPAPGGLSVEYAFTPEQNKTQPVNYYLGLGGYYALALHNTLAEAYDVADYNDLKILADNWLKSNIHQRYIGELIGWWEFDEGDGNTAADSSGYDNTGTLYNQPNWLNGALEFDGLDDYVQTADNADKLQLTGSYTLSVWLKADAVQSDWAGILAKCAAGGSNHWSLLFGGPSVPDTTGKLAVWNGAMSANRWDTEIQLTDISGQWHHIAVVRSQNIMTSYLDGDQVNCDTCDANPADGDGHLNIGTERTTSSHYKGMIDDIRIYDWPLSPDEVELLYEGSPLPPTPPESFCAGYLSKTVDLNEDCKVDFLDFAILAFRWLKGVQ